MVNAKLAAFTKKAGAVLPDDAPISSPAREGPTRRAPLKIVELRLTALARSPGPTISETNDCRTGASMAATEPSAPASRKTCQRATVPVATRIPSTRASTPISDWVIRSIRRLA